MKSNVKIFLLIVVLVVLATAVFAAPAATVKKDNDSVRVSIKPTLYRDLLMLRADKTFIGGMVEVHDSTGAIVASGHLNKKKMIIDFYNIPEGDYTICVLKNEKTLEFKYTKKQDSEIFN